MNKLTLQQLKETKPGIFAFGETIDNSNGCNVANTGKTIRWVAIRGDIHDWAIYVQNPYYIDSDDPDVIAFGYNGVWDWQKITDVGDKIHNEDNIKKLVPCEEEAFKMYRN